MSSATSAGLSTSNPTTNRLPTTRLCAPRCAAGMHHMPNFLFFGLYGHFSSMSQNGLSYVSGCTLLLHGLPAWVQWLVSTDLLQTPGGCAQLMSGPVIPHRRQKLTRAKGLGTCRRLIPAMLVVSQTVSSIPYSPLQLLRRRLGWTAGSGGDVSRPDGFRSAQRGPMARHKPLRHA